MGSETNATEIFDSESTVNHCFIFHFILDAKNLTLILHQRKRGATGRSHNLSLCKGICRTPERGSSLDISLSSGGRDSHKNPLDSMTPPHPTVFLFRFPLFSRHTKVDKFAGSPTPLPTKEREREKKKTCVEISLTAEISEVYFRSCSWRSRQQKTKVQEAQQKHQLQSSTVYQDEAWIPLHSC